MLKKIQLRIKAIADYLFVKYEWLISFLLKINKVKVDKEQFVRKVMNRYHKGDEAMLQKALSTSLNEVLTTQEKRRYYRHMMWHYGFAVFFVSFLLTLTPEDLWIVILAGALDLIFFQCVLFVAMQKILLLYGDDLDLHHDETESVEKLISIDSSGLMLGKYPLLQKLKSVLGWLGKQVVKRLGPRFVARASRSVFIVLRRQAIKWFSIVIAKEHVTLVFNALIPITCALISGIVSAVIFVPMCNKLRKHLMEK